MEVTSAMRSSVILIFLYITNTLGQRISPQNTGNSAFASVVDSPAAPSTVLGIPRGEIVVPNLPATTFAVESSPYNHFFSPLDSEESYQPEIENLELVRSHPSLLKSLISSLKHAGYFLLALLDLTDADRHDSLNNAACYTNDVIDAILYYYGKVIAFRNKVIAHIMCIPIIGTLFGLVEQVVFIINYVPMKMVELVKAAIKKIFTTKNHDHEPYPVPGIPYLYA